MFNLCSGTKILVIKLVATLHVSNLNLKIAETLPEDVVILFVTENIPGKWLIDTLQTSAILKIVAAKTKEASCCHVLEGPLIIRLSEYPLKWSARSVR
jgi:hypothetical protein